MSAPFFKHVHDIVPAQARSQQYRRYHEETIVGRRPVDQYAMIKCVLDLPYGMVFDTVDFRVYQKAQQTRANLFILIAGGKLGGVDAGSGYLVLVTTCGGWSYKGPG